jgi:hypothetical protein
MTQAMTVLSDTQLAKMEDSELAIQTIIDACEVSKLRELSVLRQSVELATGLRKLRAILSQEMMNAYFMPLQGSKLGFLTDKDKTGGYGWEAVREVLMEGMLRGLRPVGNEINIISDGCYAAVNGLERLVTTFPGLTDFWDQPGVPQLAGDKGAFVPTEARWILNGQPMEMTWDVEKRPDGTMKDNRICVKVNSGMGADAILGKARRKMFLAVYRRITNSSFAIPDGEILETTGTEVAPAPALPEQDDKRMRLGAKKPAAAAQAPKSEPANDQPRQREPGED